MDPELKKLDVLNLCPEESQEHEKRGLYFSIEGDEYDRWGKFLIKHWHKESTGKQGDQFKFHFYESGFGCIASVECLVCGEEEILTDLDRL